jgi:hypothetical protein
MVVILERQWLSYVPSQEGITFPEKYNSHYNGQKTAEPRNTSQSLQMSGETRRKNEETCRNEKRSKHS